MNCHQKGNKKLPITHYYSYVLSEVFVELWAFNLKTYSQTAAQEICAILGPFSIFKQQ